MARRTTSFWQLFADFPPALVRLLARKRAGKNVAAITAEEIAIVSGLPLDRVLEISGQTTWDGVSLPEAERFFLGCKFDPTSSQDRNRQRAYELKCKTTNRPRFLWLKNSPRFESEYLPLIRRLRTSFPKKS